MLLNLEHSQNILAPLSHQIELVWNQLSSDPHAGVSMSAYEIAGCHHMIKPVFSVSNNAGILII